MHDLENVKKQLDGVPIFGMTYRSVIEVIDELSAARKLIKAREENDKTSHRYNAIFSGSSEELTELGEIEEELIRSNIILELANKAYNEAVNGEL